MKSRPPSGSSSATNGPVLSAPLRQGIPGALAYSLLVQIVLLQQVTKRSLSVFQMHEGVSGQPWRKGTKHLVAGQYDPGRGCGMVCALRINLAPPFRQRRIPSLPVGGWTLVACSLFRIKSCGVFGLKLLQINIYLATKTWPKAWLILINRSK
jgi:hypothetical protein